MATAKTVIDLALDLTDGAGGPGGIQQVLVYDPEGEPPPWWERAMAKALGGGAIAVPAAARLINVNCVDERGGASCEGWTEWPDFQTVWPRMPDSHVPGAIGTISAKGYLWAKTFGGFETAPGKKSRRGVDTRVFDSYAAMADALIALAQQGEQQLLVQTDIPDLSDRLTESERIATAMHGFHPYLAEAMLGVLEHVWPEQAESIKQGWHVTDDSYPMPAIDLNDPRYYAVGGEVEVADQWYFEELTDAMERLAPEGFYFGTEEGGGEWGFWEIEAEEDEEDEPEENPRKLKNRLLR